MKALVIFSIIGVFSDFSAAFNCFCQKPAESALEKHQRIMNLAIGGDADAQFDIGCNYAIGTVVKQNHSHAAKWYKRASSQGHARAQYHLAIHFLNGLGVPLDLAQSKALFHQAADKGIVGAQNNLARIYFLAKDYRRAYLWFERAAMQGDAIAADVLAFMSSQGLGVEQDINLAIHWLKISAERGYARAQVALGLIYEQSAGMVANDMLAVKWYKLAASQGDDRGQCYLAEMFEAGRGGLEVNIKEAARLYQLSLDQGNDRAKRKLSALKREHFDARCHERLKEKE